MLCLPNRTRAAFMIHAASCVACAGRDLVVVHRLVFRQPRCGAYADTCDYFERRLWILFNVVEPGTGDAREFRLLHCRGCDLLFLDRRLDEAEIARKYDFLSAVQATAAEYSGKPIRGEDERARRIWRYVRPLVHRSAAERLRVCDIGGQFGHNLSAFPATFSKVVVDFETYDLYPEVKYVRPAALDTLRDCDVVMSNHTVEHLSFPGAELARWTRLLRPGGVLHMEVPLGAFREHRALREPITHVNFFSERSAVGLLSGAGLIPVHVETRFQRVTDRKEWCINALAVKPGGEALPRAMERAHVLGWADTRNALRYYPQMVIERLRRILG